MRSDSLKSFARARGGAIRNQAIDLFAIDAARPAACVPFHAAALIEQEAEQPQRGRELAALALAAGQPPRCAGRAATAMACARVEVVDTALRRTAGDGWPPIGVGRDRVPVVERLRALFQRPSSSSRSASDNASSAC